jgi:HSP20 family protein
MTLTRWERPELSFNPFRQLSVLREEIDRLFQSPFDALSDSGQPFMGGWWPAVDVYQDKDNVMVRVEVPGMKKQDIDISLHEGVLSIAGERKAEDKYQSADVHRSERFVGRFSRSVTLPSPVDTGKCSATYQEGILTVTLPKAEEAKPKQIEVKVTK